MALHQGNQSRSQHEIFESLFGDAIAPFESRREIVASGLEGFTWEQETRGMIGAGERILSVTELEFDFEIW